MRVMKLLNDMDLRKWSAKNRLALGVSLPAVVIIASLAAFPQRPVSEGAVQAAPAATQDVAQGTLPLPAPGTNPAAPTTAPSDADAKARAALLAAKANIDVTDAWAKATPANATSAAVYLHIVSGKDADKLVGVDAPDAARVEVQDDGAKTGSAPVADIPGGATVNFNPQGRHLILVGLKAPLSEGDSFLLTLKFDKAGTQSTTVKILNPSATGPAPLASTRTGDTTADVSQR